MAFSSYEQIFSYLAQKNEQVLLLLDEYPDLASYEKDVDTDSVFRRIINNLPDNIKLAISGSQMDMMKGLLEEHSKIQWKQYATIG